MDVNAINQQTQAGVLSNAPENGVILIVPLAAGVKLEDHTDANAIHLQTQTGAPYEAPEEVDFSCVL